MNKVNKNQPTIYDIAIVGGGINGCGIARDAAGRGLKTYLCDKGDLGGETSCASSKLIHGGLRYLEFYEFGLVRKALKERDILMTIAPNLVYEQRFTIPHNEHLRPRWLISLGLFIYDNLYLSRLLKGSSSVSLINSPLKDDFKHGFEYSDCVTDDHRLVIANALDAQKNGASINPYKTCTSATTSKGLWQLTIKDKDGEGHYIYAKSLINATGPWAETFLNDQLSIQKHKQLRLVKGSHIITKKLYEGTQAYTFQDEDGRIVFTIPYERDYTLIGTTEEEFDGNPSEADISDDESHYLCQVIADYFDIPITKDDIVWHYSGVRPLIKDAEDSLRETTRDYCIELNTVNALPLITIWGGKLTTYRILAEDVLMQLVPFLQGNNKIKKKWSHKKPLNLTVQPEKMCNGIIAAYPWLPEEIVDRYAKSYGKNSLLILEKCEKLSDLGEHFGAGLYDKEVRYLISEEWTNNADAVMWQRSKCGLHMTQEQRQYLSDIFPAILQEVKQAQAVDKIKEQQGEPSATKDADNSISKNSLTGIL